MMTYEQAISYVNGFTKSGEPVKDLVRFVILMRILGNPHSELKVIHIAGTNGKGSTSEYINNALMAQGKTVGKFTSPYIDCIEERIQVNNRYISRPAFALLCEQVKNAVEQSDIEGYSQFEILTAICFLYFYKEQVNYAVVETGIGGMLDCTAVVNPVVSVITSIDYDHTALLGNTIAQIASHKAGIIKPSVPCVTAPDQYEDAMNVISAKCKEFNCELVCPDYNRVQLLHMDAGDVFFSYKGMNYHLNMSGKHQIYNALCAIEACRFLDVEYSNVFTGLEKSVLPARMEQISTDKATYIIDGSHNPSAMRAAHDLLSLDKKATYAVIGMLKSKAWKSALDEILPALEQIIFVEGFSDGCVPAAELCDYAKSKGASCRVSDKLSEAIDVSAMKAGKAGYAMITGSLYLASVARKLIVK